MLRNTSKRFKNIKSKLVTSADKFGIKAKNTALNKLIFICPVNFKINNVTDVKIEITKNEVKIIFFMAFIFFNYYVINICL